VVAHRKALRKSGELQERRRRQARQWMWSLVEEGLREALRIQPAVAERLEALEAEVEEQKTTPAAAARELLEVFRAG
jgi:LAO/AO transport system kinase